MPNHVTNIITTSEEVIKTLLDDRNEVDFNKIIPEPEELTHISKNGDERFIEQLVSTTAPKCLFNPDVFNSPVRLENFIKMLKAYHKYGYPTWYEFRYAKWGTKWNAYNSQRTTVLTSKGFLAAVKFETAWSACHPILQHLAKQFPDVQIEHKWADEDIGHNCGCTTYYRNAVEETNLIDPVDFALTVTGRSRDYYSLNEHTQLWERNVDE